MSAQPSSSSNGGAAGEEDPEALFGDGSSADLIEAIGSSADGPTHLGIDSSPQRSSVSPSLFLAEDMEFMEATSPTQSRKATAPRKRNFEQVYGSAEYYAKCDFPDGALTIDELALWPERLLERLFQGPEPALKKARIESALGAGKVMHSYFSGELGAETSNRMQSKAMHLAGWNIPKNNIVSFFGVRH